MLVHSLIFASSGDKVQLGKITAEVRQAYLKRATIWEPTDISKKDILQGPESEAAVPYGGEVTCRYVEPKEKLEGVQPKFLCRKASGELLRVKYGKETMEIYAEVAASRLLWAIGFHADAVYPARVKCLDCPEDPFRSSKDDPRGFQVFPDAIVEAEFPGVVIEEKKDQGWTWKDLDQVDAREGGALRSQIDALKLLAVFLQHADSKADNQRLACLQVDIQDPDGDGIGYCAKPVLMLQDVGSTFGSGTTAFHISKMDFGAWMATPIWNTPKEAELSIEKNRPSCIGNITSSRLAGVEGLTDPVISDAGREFLASLLEQLTVKQIRDLFRVAGVERLEQYVEREGIRQRVSADDWTSAFIKKRAALRENKCSDQDIRTASRQ